MLAFVAILIAGFAGNKGIVCLPVRVPMEPLGKSCWKAQAADRVPFSQDGVDPYQGNFDAYYPGFREYLLPSALAIPFTRDVPNNLTTYVIYAGFFCCYAAPIFLRVAVGFDRPTAPLLGSFLLPLM